MMTKLYFLIICFLLTEAAPAETAKEGDRRASQTTTSDHYIPCISTNKEIRHEMHKVINYCESLIIDTVIKNVTDLTNKEMKILERALPSISDSFNSSLQKLTRKINTLEQKLNQNSCLKDCAEWRSNGKLASGVYKVCPSNGPPTNVYCDMATDGGGWVVFQSRKEGYLHFNRSWENYRSGFGDLNGEFWLGFDKITRFTGVATELRIDLIACNNSKGHAKYRNFHIGDSSSKYLLTISGYTGDIGDMLSHSNNMKFSTYDNDNDRDNNKNCASERNAGYWYDHCGEYESFPKTALNGPYPDHNHRDASQYSLYHHSSKFIFWKGWPSPVPKHDAICNTQMKLRRIVQA